MEQDCDTGCRRWNRNRSSSHDCRLPALLGAGLTLQLASANPQSSHPEHYDHGAELPHSEPTHDDHDHQPSKLMKNASQEGAEALIPIDTGTE
jgi:hypothetical protein